LALDAALACRSISARDDHAIAAVIRDVMTEHGCSGPGFSIHDPEVAAMSAAYQSHESRYVVVEHLGEVVGGGGFARLPGSALAEATCELRTMYFRSVARGRGLGAELLQHLRRAMREAGYRRCYLETTTPMHAAQKLYRRADFAERCGSMSNTGHHGCDRFFHREL
jgi:putative acetyltransferase